MLTSASSPDLDARTPGRIEVPDEALRFLLFQRTDYLALPRRPLLYRALRRLSRRPPLDAAIALESQWRGGAVRRAFNRDMAREYAEIAPHLPRRAAAILDIGCGVGGIDVLLHRHYGSPRLYLADRTETSGEVYYGFSERGAFYNSLEATRRLLVANGVPESALRFREVGEPCRLDVPEGVDLAISLISWGFHYPVEVYADQVRALLRPGGRVILDARKGTDGRAQLEARFPRVTRISESRKKERLCAEL
ncbi:MAG TPA: class I SAM-dependent methyltransferase [Planctomycetota bacterium]|nr:class I SAM-dependent methyltransferase [Planctomycetota bacterium]